MSETIYLHHYDASPFTQKAIKMLAVKNARWRSVIHPMVPPKEDLTALTGGYRGTPVLQIGADIYIDAQRIAEELETRIATPTLYPDGKGIAHMLTDWSDAYFRSGLDMVLHDLAGDWDEAFLADRKHLFSNLDFSKAKERYPDGCARLRNSARLINDQLEDGRAFMCGDAPGLADIQCYVTNWFVRAAFPIVSELFSDFENLSGWEEKMAALGEGDRAEAEAEMAHEAARNSQNGVTPHIDADDPLGFCVEDMVMISPVTSRRGEAKGKLLRLTAMEVVIEPTEAAIDGVAVHYPRLGYKIARA